MTHGNPKYFVGLVLLFLPIFSVSFNGCIKLTKRGTGVSSGAYSLTLRGTVFLEQQVPEDILQISVFRNNNKEWLGFGDVESIGQEQGGLWSYAWTFSSPAVRENDELLVLVLGSNQNVLSSKLVDFSVGIDKIDIWDSFPLSGTVLHENTAVPVGTVYVVDRYTERFSDLMENTVFMGQLTIQNGIFEGVVSAGAGYLLVSLADGSLFIAKKPVELPLAGSILNTANMAQLAPGNEQAARAINSSTDDIPAFSGAVVMNGGPVQGGMLFAVASLDGTIEPLGSAEIKEGAFSGFVDQRLESGYIIANLGSLNSALTTYVSKSKYTRFTAIRLDINVDFTLGETGAAANGNLSGIVAGGSEPVKEGVIFIIPRRAESLADLPREEPSNLGYIQNGTFTGHVDLPSGYLVAGINADVYVSKNEYTSPFTDIKLNIREMDYLGNWQTADYSNFNGVVFSREKPSVEEGLVFIIPYHAKTLADLPQEEPEANVGIIQDGKLRGYTEVLSGYLVAGIGADVYISRNEYRTPFTGLKLNLDEMDYLGNWQTADYSNLNGIVFRNNEPVEQGIVYLIPNGADSFADLPQKEPVANVGFIHDSKLSGSVELESGYLVIGIDADVYISKNKYFAPFTDLVLDAGTMNYLGNWQQSGDTAPFANTGEGDTETGESTMETARPAPSRSGIRVQAGPARRPSNN